MPRIDKAYVSSASATRDVEQQLCESFADGTGSMDAVARTKQLLACLVAARRNRAAPTRRLCDVGQRVGIEPSDDEALAVCRQTVSLVDDATRKRIVLANGGVGQNRLLPVGQRRHVERRRSEPHDARIAAIAQRRVERLQNLRKRMPIVCKVLLVPYDSW
jgi:hypothetical protein